MPSFPDRFLWGASTAGHQVEGGNVNADVWLLEWAENSMFTEPSGDACDHYHRYGEDIALLAEVGLNAYRFSIEWARIEPEEGFFSRASLDHYRRVLAACHEHDITPVVTFNHFTVPAWFAGAGGWGAASAAERFGRFAERATAHLGDLIPWACTMNEPNLAVLMSAAGLPSNLAGDGGDIIRNLFGPAATRGGYDPDRFRPWPVTAPVEMMADAHRLAADAIKSGPGDTQVGWTLALADLQLVEGGEERYQNALQQGELDWLDVSRDDDFVGVQTYTRERVGPDGFMPAPDGAATHQTGWEVYPEALEHTVRLASQRTGGPVLVTENGMATDDDDARIAHTRTALEGVARCIADGIDVRGYLHWSWLDNFEWNSGFAKTFGLVAVDRTTFERTVKPSARWLGQIARVNALD